MLLWHLHRVYQSSTNRPELQPDECRQQAVQYLGTLAQSCDAIQALLADMHLLFLADQYYTRKQIKVSVLGSARFSWMWFECQKYFHVLQMSFA